MTTSVPHYYFCTLPAGESDEEDGDQNSGDLPSLESGTQFGELATPEETWAKIWEDVKAALLRRGYTSATVIRKIGRVRSFDIKLMKYRHMIKLSSFRWC